MLKSNQNLTRVEVWHCSPGHLNVVAAEEKEECVAGEADHVEEQDELQNRGTLRMKIEYAKKTTY